MKRNNLRIGLMAFAILLASASCSDDDNTPSYSTGVMQNTELKTILVQRGFTFNEDGHLLLDDLAKNTTTLDLSGTQVPTDALAELSMFPNLTDVDLSDNGYGPAFDFSCLPEQVTGVDLTGNEIYDYDNLAELDEEENVNVLRSGLTKLYLPGEAKDNCTAIMLFYFQNKNAVTGGNIDMKIENEDGDLQTYTSMRDVPNAVLREYLQSQFSNMFEGEQIDITNSFGLDEQTNNILIEGSVVDIDAITSLEGLQYFVMHPLWKGTTLTINFNSVREHGSEDFSQCVALPRLKLGTNLSKLEMKNVNIENGLDLTEATNIFIYRFEGIALETLDLSKSNIWGQRGESVEFDELQGSSVCLHDLPLLKELTLPAGQIYINTVDLECLPMLDKADLSSIQKTASIIIGDLGESTELTYPTLAGHYTGNPVNTTFGCTESTWEYSETQAFVKTYYTDKEKADRLANTTPKLCSVASRCRWWRK